MAQAGKPIRTTVLGGLIFLVPFAIVAAVFGKVFEVMHRIAAPLSRWLPVEHVGGIAIVPVVTVLLMILVCYLAGVLATRGRARRLYTRIDETLLNVLPRYTFIKAMAQGLDSSSIEATLSPVIVQFDDLAQVAFEVERDEERVVVFLPGSPDPWSGSTAIVTVDRVRRVRAPFPQVVRSVRLIGRGTVKILGGDTPA